jgi:hypothetical protein
MNIAQLGITIAHSRFKMRHTGLFAGTLALALASNANAQTGIRPPQGWSLGVAGGAAAFSDMQRGTMRVIRPSGSGMEQREFTRRVGAETSTTLAAYISFWPSRNWGLRAHASWAPSRFETIMKEADAEFAGVPTTSAESQSLAGLSIISTDLQALFRLPTIKNRVMLYGILGGGLARYSVQPGDEPVPPEAEGDFEGGVKVRPAGVIGLGAMLPLRNRAFRMHFELTNHISATPLEGGEGETIVNDDGTIEFLPRDEPAGERRVSIVSGVRFVVGLSFSPRK